LKFLKILGYSFELYYVIFFPGYEGKTVFRAEWPCGDDIITEGSTQSK
jgi:hypothetical protein